MWANDDDKIESLRRLLTLSREIAMMLDVVDASYRGRESVAARLSRGNVAQDPWGRV